MPYGVHPICRRPQFHMEKTMKLSKTERIGAFCLMAFVFSGLSLCAQDNDLVLNDGFELQSTDLWTETGTVLPTERGVAKYTVTLSGGNSWAYYQHPGDGFSGGIEQLIHVEAGETYRVEADFCYKNC